MKKIFFFILLFVSFQSFAQNRFPSVDSLRNYILRYIKNSAVESFTNLRMQNVVYGLSELSGVAGVDSIWRVAGKDSIFFRKNNTTFAIKDSIGSGGGADSSIFATRFYTNQTFVPYTGAINDVDLGNFRLNARGISVTGTNGNGNIHLRHQSSLPSGTGQSTTLYANNDGNLEWLNDGGYRTTLSSHLNTANRVYKLQNKSYTLADSLDLTLKLNISDTTNKHIGIGWLPTLAGKQDLLASGINIKTINNNSILGSGNLVISGGGASISDSTLQWATNNGKTTTNNIFVGSHNTVSSDTAEVAPYKTFTTGSANYGSGQNSWGISFDASLRIRQKGYIRYIKLNVVSLPARLTSFYITIWRKSSGIAFNIIDSVNILPYLQVGVNTIQLPKKLYAQDGDYIGWGYSSSSSGSNFLNLQSLTGGGAIGYYYNTAASHPADGTAFIGLSSLNQYLPIVAYMDAPAIVFIGDSKTSGYNSSISSYTEEATSPVRGQSFPDLVADSLALTFQNMGIGNTTITTTVQRFQKDVVEAKPKYVVIEIGVNSIALGISTDSIMNDYRRILAACTTNSIKPIIVKILPWTNGSNAQNRRRDSINNLLVTEATNYNAILIDCSAEVGQFRVGGDAGNLWDIVPAYTSDGVHFTALGYRVIASKIYQTLRTQLDNRFPTNPTDGGAILQVNSRDKGFGFPIWNAYQSLLNDSLHFRFREGVVAYNEGTQTLKLNKRNGFKDIVTQDYPVSGTNATRLSLTGMPAGTRYFQTDYLVGDWIYTGSSWRYQIHDFVINREFERAAFNSFQNPTEVTFSNGGTSGSWFTIVSGMEIPVAIGTGTNSNGGTILSNHAGADNLLPLTNKIFSTTINLSSLGALSNSTDRYVVRVGMGNAPSSISEAASFVGVRYCDTINGGAFQAYARNSGVETTANTSITAVLGTTYEIVITHYGSSVEYWINGVKAATISTNVPIGGRGGYHSIFKTSGTTSRSLILSGVKLLKF